MVEIARTLQSAEVPFSVKPHPREQAADYDSIEGLDARSADDSPSGTLVGAELALVGISTVIEEAVLARVPVAVLGRRVHGTAFDAHLPDADAFPRVESGEDVLRLVMSLRDGSIDREELLGGQRATILRRVSEDSTESAAHRVATVVNEVAG